MKILIIKFRNIGDVLLTTPLIKNLKLNFPNSKIYFALNKGTEEMLTLNPYVNKLYIYEREQIKKLNIFKKSKKELDFIKDIKKEKYDIIINLTNGDRGTLISLLCNGKIKIGYKKNLLSRLTFTHYMPKNKNFQHIIDKDLDSLKIINKKVTEKKVEIYWNNETELSIKKILSQCNIEDKKFIHIHPVSRWFFKCIEDKLMAKIIDFCEKQLNLKVVLTSAPIPKEIEKVNKILSYCSSSPINLSGLLTLKQTAALNKRAKFFIGVDTAVMHISAANNVPVLAFFGPSGSFNWGPWDNNFLDSGYTQKNGYQIMGKHKVIQVNWGCSPCGQDGCNGSKISECLMEKALSFEFIKSKIEEINNDKNFGA